MPKEEKEKKKKTKAAEGGAAEAGEEKKKKKKDAGDGEGKKPKKTEAEKKAMERLKEIAGALAYGVQAGFVDLERSTKLKHAVTAEELKLVLASLVSSEKLNATAQGRQARAWAGVGHGSSDSHRFTDVDAQMLFDQLDAKKTGVVDLNAFLEKAVNTIKVGANEKEVTKEAKAKAARVELLKTLDWTDLEAIISTFPVYAQQQIALMRTKGVAKDVNIEEFDLRVPFSTNYLLDCASLRIPQRSKMGLMGEPGSGKSTLFYAMASGEIKGFPTHLDVHHMKEIEVSPDAENLLDTVIHSHKFLCALRDARTHLEKRLAADGYPAPTADQKAKYEVNLDYVSTKLREMNSDDAEEEASKSLKVLGFDSIAQTKSTNSLSGGLRMRVALASAFFVEADILLLDEPTNHLDFPSLLWLENRLRSYRKTFVLVCHDRDILNNVCQSIMTITEEKGLKLWEMGFAAYEVARDKQEKKYAAEVDKFLARNRNIDFSSPLAVEAKVKRTWLENYNRKMVMRAGQFTFPAPTDLVPDNEQLGQTVAQEDVSVIRVTNVTFSYDPLTLPFIFKNPISIDIKMSTRMGVMGPNGAGKSTFLKLITKRLLPVSGTITENKNARIAYFAQHHSAEMDLTMTPMDFMLHSFPDEKVGQLRGHLAKVGCTGSLTDTRMNDLSQGMRSCVGFAKITYFCPHLLIMDEPTNFLDIETVDALISAANKYRGALLLVSHSRLFLNKCATAYLSIVPGQFLAFPTMGECERATYTFIAELESGGKVKIGSGALAKHGSNAGSGSSSEKAAEIKGGIAL